MASNFEDVQEFMRKFGLPLPDKPALVPLDVAIFRYEFLQEELNELFLALSAAELDQIADALVDLVYVAMGTAIVYGLPWQELWDEVQKTNMAKERVKNLHDSKRGHRFDVIKPDGWVPPDLNRVLADFGWTLHPEDRV